MPSPVHQPFAANITLVTLSNVIPESVNQQQAEQSPAQGENVKEFQITVSIL